MTTTGRLVTWCDVPVGSVADGGDGWRYDDAGTALKLASLVRRYGQLRPVVVRTAPDGGMRVVRGRKLLRAVRDAGLPTCMVADVGEADDAEAARIALALEVGFEVDYARLARAVAALLEAGASPEELAAGSPFQADRVRYFGVLARFDWSQFAPPRDGQSAMDWDAEAPQAGDVPRHEAPQVPAEERLEAVAEEAVEEAALLASEPPQAAGDGQAALF